MIFKILYFLEVSYLLIASIFSFTYLSIVKTAASEYLVIILMSASFFCWAALNPFLFWIGPIFLVFLTLNDLRLCPGHCESDAKNSTDSVVLLQTMLIFPILAGTWYSWTQILISIFWAAALISNQFFNPYLECSFHMHQPGTRKNVRPRTWCTSFTFSHLWGSSFIFSICGCPKLCSLVF